METTKLNKKNAFMVFKVLTTVLIISGLFSFALAEQLVMVTTLHTDLRTVSIIA